MTVSELLAHGWVIAKVIVAEFDDDGNRAILYDGRTETPEIHKFLKREVTLWECHEIDELTVTVTPEEHCII